MTQLFFTWSLGDVWSRRRRCRRLGKHILSYTVTTEVSLRYWRLTNAFPPLLTFPRRHQTFLPLLIARLDVRLHLPVPVFREKENFHLKECNRMFGMLQLNTFTKKNVLNVAPNEYACNSTVDGTYGAQSLHFTCFYLSFFSHSIICNVCFTIACFSRFLRAKIAKKYTHFLCFRRTDVHIVLLEPFFSFYLPQYQMSS